MSYKKAAHILPRELLEQVQEYVDGEYLYIHGKKEAKIPLIKSLSKEIRCFFIKNLTSCMILSIIA